MVNSVAALPAEVLGVVSAWLTPRETRHLGLTCRDLLGMPFQDAVARRHLRLRLPLDPQVCATLAQAYSSALVGARLLPTRVALNLTSQLGALQKTLCAHDLVAQIQIEPTRVFACSHDVPTGVWCGLDELSHFGRLVHLEITINAMWSLLIAALDLTVIPRSAPMLELLPRMSPSSTKRRCALFCDCVDWNSTPCALPPGAGLLGLRGSST